MKLSFCIIEALVLTVITLFAAPTANSAPSEKPARPEHKTEVSTNESRAFPQSIFTVPSNPTEGRNPFFPKSGSSDPSAHPTSTPDSITLVLGGLGGTPEKKLAIINNKTFEEGESQEVSSGSARLKIRCIEIKTDSVVVDIIGGERKELRLRSAN
jgi:hypothetical protein